MKEFRIWYWVGREKACFVRKAKNRESLVIPGYAAKALIEVEELETDE